jgi:hypothetical protein
LQVGQNKKQQKASQQKAKTLEDCYPDLPNFSVDSFFISPPVFVLLGGMLHGSSHNSVLSQFMPQVFTK